MLATATLIISIMFASCLPITPLFWYPPTMDRKLQKSLFFNSGRVVSLQWTLFLCSVVLLISRRWLFIIYSTLRISPRSSEPPNTFSTQVLQHSTLLSQSISSSNSSSRPYHCSLRIHRTHAFQRSVLFTRCSCGRIASWRLWKILVDQSFVH